MWLKLFELGIGKGPVQIDSGAGRVHEEEEEYIRGRGGGGQRFC